MKSALSYAIGFTLFLTSVGASAAFVLNTSAPGAARTIDSSTVTDGTLDLSREGPIIPNSTYSNGWVGAPVSWDGATPTGGWSFQYLGKQASWNNLFQFSDGRGGWQTVFANRDYTSAEQVAAGVFSQSDAADFGFQFVTLAGADGTLGGNSAALTHDHTLLQQPGNLPAGSVKFFATIANNDLVLWLEDGGDGSDFSDMGIRISAVSAVPIPAAGWLFGSALVGLGVAARRRNRVCCDDT